MKKFELSETGVWEYTGALVEEVLKNITDKMLPFCKDNYVMMVDETDYNGVFHAGASPATCDANIYFECFFHDRGTHGKYGFDDDEFIDEKSGYVCMSSMYGFESEVTKKLEYYSDAATEFHKFVYVSEIRHDEFKKIKIRPEIWRQINEYLKWNDSDRHRCEDIHCYDNYKEALEGVFGGVMTIMLDSDIDKLTRKVKKCYEKYHRE